MCSAASWSLARLDELRHACWRGQPSQRGVFSRACHKNRQGMLTSSWLYSFSKRCRRRAGSFAKSLRELADDSGVCARRRDHCGRGDHS